MNTMEEIQHNQLYTTEEARNFLRISERTMKRWLKKGIIRANKLGGRYRILGSELLELVSPEMERKADGAYKRFKKRVREKIASW
ncbi:helix-turn-helix domain-containing protein [Patescibacteria group bacterium]|nr:helix-turn-helix domain-containing protein [Patescibacteria group bacterium]